MEFQASVEFQAAAPFALDRTTETVSVYTRHGADCPKSSEPYWRRCRCLKYLYIYHNGTSRQISARTRSWEKAEQKAHEIRASIDPTNQLRRQLEAKIQGQPTAVFSLSQRDVPTLRRWIHSWPGSPTTRHNQHQRIIAFFNFCIEQGWIKENPAKRIKKVPRQQDETLPFTREQYDVLIEATHYYDGRGQERNGETTNWRRVRAYLKLLRWSGLEGPDRGESESALEVFICGHSSSDIRGRAFMELRRWQLLTYLRRAQGGLFKWSQLQAQ